MKADSKTNRLLTCLIFAGGEASRLHPHTMLSSNQKPMLVMGSPTQKLIDYSLRASTTGDHTYVIVHHESERAAVVEDYVLGWPNVQVMRDRRPVDAGSLIDHYETFSNEDPNGSIVVLAPDHVHEGFDLGDFYQGHLDSEAPITLLTSLPKDYGEYTVDHGGRASGVFASFFPGAVSTCGTYIVKTGFLMEWVYRRRIAGWNGERLSLYDDMVCPAIENGEASVFSLPQSAYWDDAGTLVRYYKNNMRISKQGNVVAAEAVVPDSVSLSKSVVIGSANLEGPMTITSAIVSGSGDQICITQVGA